MTTSYFKLPQSTQRALLQTASHSLGIDPKVLEKDIWVCWTLQTLFSMPNAHPMAFKGGTSLSKVYNVIYRFSEDVDVTLDYTRFEPETRVSELSNTQCDKFIKRLQDHVKDYLANTVVPHLHDKVTPVSKKATVTLQDNGENIHIDYPSALEKSTGLAERVLIEFGGKNVINPSKLQTIETDMQAYVDAHDVDIALPCATQVTVLAAERTFWEKITLIHAKCQQGTINNAPEKMARHWYDVAMLLKNDVGQDALNKESLFHDVVAHKKKFYRSARANYDACLAQGLTLIPQENSALQSLEQDYNNMIKAGMMYETPPSFNEIIEVVRDLELLING